MLKKASTLWRIMLKYFLSAIIRGIFLKKDKFVSNDLIFDGKLYILLEGTKLLSISLV